MTGEAGILKPRCQCEQARPKVARRVDRIAVHAAPGNANGDDDKSHQDRVESWGRGLVLRLGDGEDHSHQDRRADHLVQQSERPCVREFRKGRKHLCGFAQVGIIALVDEATGYQAERAKDDLMRILEAYISKGLLPWTKRFPDIFFEEVYRLEGWEFREGHHKRPRHVGKLIKKLIYEKLPPGVLGELQRRNPVKEYGYRRHKHHQFLSHDIGHPHLDKQITAVMTPMRVSDDKSTFKRLFERAFPHRGQQLPLAIEETAGEE